MRPGVTMRPLTSRTSPLGPGARRAPISWTRPLAKAMSATRSMFWLGSMMRPPLSTRSAMLLCLLRVLEFEWFGQRDAAAAAGGMQGVLEQAGDRHRPDAAGHPRDRA